MCKELTEAERIAVHECGHAIIAVEYGYELVAVRIDGPPDNPGNIERTIPGGGNGNEPNWARKELALFSAGYLSERLFFVEEDKRYVTGHPDADRPMMDQCAIVSLDIASDIREINGSRNPNSGCGPMPRNLWRRYLRKIDWGVYDKLIHAVEEEVKQVLKNHVEAVCVAARILNKQRALSGPEFQAALQNPSPCADPDGITE